MKHTLKLTHSDYDDDYYFTRWECPDCGRIVEFTIEPEFKYEVINVGADVPHHGGKIHVSSTVEREVPSEFRDYLEGLE